MSSRKEVETLLDAVVARFRGRAELSLDELAEALEHPGVTYADIEVVIDALEGAGVDVGPTDGGDVARELADVLVAARALDRELGRRPTVDEIAVRASLDRGVVRRALLYARTLAA